MFLTKYYGLLMEIRKLLVIVLFFYIVSSTSQLGYYIYYNGFQFNKGWVEWFFVYLFLFYFCFLLIFGFLLIKILKNINKKVIVMWFFKKNNIIFIKFVFYIFIIINLFFLFLLIIFFKYDEFLFVNFFFFFIKSIARIDYSAIYIYQNKFLLYYILEDSVFVNSFFIILLLYIISIILCIFIVFRFLRFLREGIEKKPQYDIDLRLYFYGLFLIYCIICTTIYYNFSILLYFFLFDFILCCIFRQRNKFINVFRFHYNIILISLIKYIIAWSFPLAYLFIYFYCFFFGYYVFNILKFECFFW